ncbi:MAG: hypothetical protein WCN95_10435 [bacterium]
MSEHAGDREILRELGRRKFEIGNLPVQKEKAGLWSRLNGLKSVRPLVWISQVPWHEMNWNNELTMLCQNPDMRWIEAELRIELYQWDHFPGDMVVEPVIYSGIVGGPDSTYNDYGLIEQHVRHDDGQDVGYLPIIHTEADADKIRTPRVWFDHEATEKNFQTLLRVFDGVIPVQKRLIAHQWHSPWDQIIHWYGIEQLYTDMYDRPQLVHRILRNFTRALNEVLDQQEALGMLEAGNGNYSVGSGGPGYTDELPQPDFNPAHVRLKDQWGCSTGQIFSEVSPGMHEEFCLQYERPVMERFGLTYYGCCEPLHKKVGMLRSVKNLRKISMSPWINVAEGSEQIGKDFVFSYKPNPAHLGMLGWNADLVRTYLSDVVRQTRENCVELILKDITTVRGEPQRLWEWAKIAFEVVNSE